MRWRRLIRGELIPLIAKVVLWGAIALVLGMPPLLQLLAASFCINAAYGLCSVYTSKPLRRRRNAAPEIFATATQRAWLLEGSSMLACLVVLVLIGALYTGMGRNEIVPLLLMMGWGLPARCNGPLRARHRKPHLPRLLRGCLGLALVGLVLLLGPSAGNVALALAAREWLTLLVLAILPRRPRKVGQVARRADAPAWKEFHAATAAQSMRRFFYQASRSVLHFALGPFGTVLARTGRGLGLMKRADSFARARIFSAVFAVTGLSATVLVARLVPGPFGLATSALMLRLGCLGTGATFWSWLSPPDPEAVLDADPDDLD